MKFSLQVFVYLSFVIISRGGKKNHNFCSELSDISSSSSVFLFVHFPALNATVIFAKGIHRLS